MPSNRLQPASQPAKPPRTQQPGESRQKKQQRRDPASLLRRGHPDTVAHCSADSRGLLPFLPSGPRAWGQVLPGDQCAAPDRHPRAAPTPAGSCRRPRVGRPPREAVVRLCLGGQRGGRAPHGPRSGRAESRAWSHAAGRRRGGAWRQGSAHTGDGVAGLVRHIDIDRKEERGQHDSQEQGPEPGAPALTRPQDQLEESWGGCRAPTHQGMTHAGPGLGSQATPALLRLPPLLRATGKAGRVTSCWLLGCGSALSEKEMI